jgi:hypothetical protein
VFAMVGVVPTALAQTSDDWLLRLSVPYINSFYLQPTGEPDAKVNTGFWGIGVALLFRHTPSQYLGVAAGAAIDFPLPVIGMVDFVGEHEFMSAWAFDLTNEHARGRWSFGYGLSYGGNRWALEYFDDPGAAPPTRAPVVRHSRALGLVLPTRWTLNDRVTLGSTYRPNVYRLGSDAGFHYEHVVSIEIAWNLGLH